MAAPVDGKFRFVFPSCDVCKKSVNPVTEHTQTAERVNAFVCTNCNKLICGLCRDGHVHLFGRQGRFAFTPPPAR